MPAFTPSEDQTEKEPRTMDATAGIRALSREEIEEALASLRAIEGYVGGLVYRDAVDAMASISIVRDIIGECLPVADEEVADLWIEWDGGGPCPIVAGTIVDIVRRDGDEIWGLRAGIPGNGLAAPTFWRHMNHPSDIVRYRISSLAPPARSDGGLGIQTTHFDIRTSVEMPDG